MKSCTFGANFLSESDIIKGRMMTGNTFAKIFVKSIQNDKPAAWGEANGNINGMAQAAKSEDNTAYVVALAAFPPNFDDMTATAVAVGLSILASQPFHMAVVHCGMHPYFWRAIVTKAMTIWKAKTIHSHFLGNKSRGSILLNSKNSITKSRYGSILVTTVAI